MAKKHKHLQNTNPRETIKHFFEEYSIDDCRFLLWEMLLSSISYDETPGHMRHMFMGFYQQLKELVEVNHLILKNKIFEK